MAGPQRQRGVSARRYQLRLVSVIALYQHEQPVRVDGAYWSATHQHHNALGDWQLRHVSSSRHRRRGWWYFFSRSPSSAAYAQWASTAATATTELFRHHNVTSGAPFQPSAAPTPTSDDIKGSRSSSNTAATDCGHNDDISRWRIRRFSIDAFQPQHHHQRVAQQEHARNPATTCAASGVCFVVCQRWQFIIC